MHSGTALFFVQLQVYLRPAQSPFILSNPTIYRMLLKPVLPSLEKGCSPLTQIRYRDLIFQTHLFDEFASQ
ncbi:MAG: hypothetical protein WCL03_14705 [Bacteroidota bacterium]